MLLDGIAAGKRIELAAHDAGVSRRTAFNWRSADPSLAEEWDAAYDEATDKLEDVLYRKALDGDLGSLVFALRSRMPRKYNPALIARLEMLAMMKAKAAAEAAPMIEGQVNGSGNGGHIIVPEFISILSLPWNARGPSPHVPGGYEPGDEEPLVIVPFPQDGSGLTMPLPRGVQVEHHSPPFEHLPVTLTTDSGPVPPAAATDLWRRIQAHNRWLAEAYPGDLLKVMTNSREHRPRIYIPATDPEPDDNEGDQSYC